MKILLSGMLPRGRVVAVHAPLGEVEEPGAIENPFRRRSHPPRH